MIRTVVLMVGAPFGKRDYDRYGVDILKRNNFVVQIWNLSFFLYPATRSYALNDSLDEDVVTNFQSSLEVCNALKSLDEAFIYTTVGLDLNTFNIFRIISKNRIPYCVIGLNANLPFHQYSSSLVKKIVKITPKKIFRFAFNRLPISMLSIRPADYITVIGSKCLHNRKEVSTKTKRLYTHSHDYDIFLKEKNNICLTKTAIFLDNYLPYHPDSLYSGEKNPVTAEIYHRSLNRFFNVIESQLGLQVVVAAHPRSNYCKDRNPFHNRTIVKGNTAALVKNSSLVITNFSTAVNFAVLFKKPLLIFTTIELNSNGYQDYIRAFANIFGKRPLNIDFEITLEEEEIFSVNQQLYESYQDGYIKVNGSPEKFQWQIISDEIKRLSND